MIPVAYLFVLATAEAFVGFGSLDIGLTIHISLVFALVFHTALRLESDRTMAVLLLAMSLAPSIGSCPLPSPSTHSPC